MQRWGELTGGRNGAQWAPSQVAPGSCGFVSGAQCTISRIVSHCLQWSKQLLGWSCSLQGLHGMACPSSELCFQGTCREVCLRSVCWPWLKLACRFNSYREDRLSVHEHRRSHTVHDYIRLVSLGNQPKNRDSSQQGPDLLVKRQLSLKGHFSGQSCTWGESWWNRGWFCCAQMGAKL